MSQYQKQVNEAGTLSRHLENQRRQGPTVTYHLYLYREELSRRNVEYMRLSKAKYFITEKLLAKTVRNLKSCSVDELKAVNHQIVFRHKLKRQIHRLRKLQSLGIKNANPHMESTEL
ncbi:uncharacterized protein LOC115622550 [Scaptodrosophila lebanonensis]|uniref:Uncharacterized protein LOC115622550 n=1 Tax=Drosophila lebanonensis TaxID=7225 RepID=A0A6J2TBP5_DROLE|nr:uncharacterized protein LOC115622550 [Scaptodrosophila lebanonensis]